MSLPSRTINDALANFFSNALVSSFVDLSESGFT